MLIYSRIKHIVSALMKNMGDAEKEMVIKYLRRQCGL